MPSLAHHRYRHRRHVLFRNFKLHEVENEYFNCTSHTSMHPRITHPHYEPNEPTSPVGRWSRPQPVLVALDEQQTFLKLNKSLTWKIVNWTPEINKILSFVHKKSANLGLQYRKCAAKQDVDACTARTRLLILNYFASRDFSSNSIHIRSR